jgi:hypothetical protein
MRLLYETGFAVCGEDELDAALVIGGAGAGSVWAERRRVSQVPTHRSVRVLVHGRPRRDDALAVSS